MLPQREASPGLHEADSHTRSEDWIWLIWLAPLIESARCLGGESALSQLEEERRSWKSEIGSGRRGRRRERGAEEGNTREGSSDRRRHQTATVANAEAVQKGNKSHKFSKNGNCERAMSHRAQKAERQVAEQCLRRKDP